MMYARSLMDSDNPILSDIGYKIWSNDGKLSEEQVFEIARMIVDYTESLDNFQKALEDAKLEAHSKGYQQGAKDFGPPEPKKKRVFDPDQLKRMIAIDT